MGSAIRACSVAMVLGLVGAEAQAQRPPKYVRTPYAEVYRDPFGGKHIRTPFVEIHKPGYRMPPSYVGPPIYYAVPEEAMPDDAMIRSQPQPSRAASAGMPTPATDFSRLDWQGLRQMIHDANDELKADLRRAPSRFSMVSLKTDDLARLVPLRAVGPPTELAREDLQEMVRGLDALSNDPDRRSVTSLPSFRKLRSALREYTLPPDVRASQQLYSAAAELNQSLQQFPTVKTWQRYFALTPGSAMAPDQRAGEEVPSTADFATLLSRFDSVSQDPQYPMIAELPAFQRTHNLLRVYVSEYLADVSSTTEELPAPRANEARREAVPLDL
jgi:hypothetical protein